MLMWNICMNLAFRMSMCRYVGVRCALFFLLFLSPYPLTPSQQEECKINANFRTFEMTDWKMLNFKFVFYFVGFLFNLEQIFRRLKWSWMNKRREQKKTRKWHTHHVLFALLRGFGPDGYRNVTHVRFLLRSQTQHSFRGLIFYVYPWNELRLKCHFKFFGFSHQHTGRCTWVQEKIAWLAL